ncbi:protein of unknown function [Pseudomonas cuatrocienegasensis]|uniref:DUF3859 domain-containing protein n=1 Tax=Pseudomonas cuatrocienegasensis TaxID=543360 RepID=A0ABY1B2K6_9PSED|nr:protein of unknown function [Pseudomonas cuatrocienegasensis]
MTQRNQPIERVTEVPARLGSKVGMRYSLRGNAAGETPLTLLFLAPAGVRHDKFVVTQALVANTAQETMALECSEPMRSYPVSGI